MKNNNQKIISSKPQHVKILVSVVHCLDGGAMLHFYLPAFYFHFKLLI